MLARPTSLYTEAMSQSHPAALQTPARLEGRATWLVSRAYALSSSLLNSGFEAAGGGLRGYHFRLLSALEEYGPTSQADLSRSTGIDPSDVTHALGELESRGLVERSVDP